MAAKKKRRRKSKLLNHLIKLGFTNRYALYIWLFLFAGIVGGFYLALKSIAAQYSGSLICWTVVFTPIGTACAVVLAKIVDKSKAENTGGNGDGIKYALAMEEIKNTKAANIDSPAI